MKYAVSQTHSTLEEPNGFWYVIDLATNKRIGYGFADYKDKESALMLASLMNEAYREGLQAASKSLVNNF